MAVLIHHNDALSALRKMPSESVHCVLSSPPYWGLRVSSGGQGRDRDGADVLDCFGGAGTTGLVASRLGRSAVLVEISEKYAWMSAERIRDDCPLLVEVEVRGPDHM